MPILPRSYAGQYRTGQRAGISGATEGTMTTFISLLTERWQKNTSVCIGLDSDYRQLPETVKQGRSVEEAMFAFNRAIIDATHDLVCAYKPNTAFYEAQGDAGLRALTRTVQYIK